MGETESVTDFFSSWANYRAVIESDAMEHSGIYGLIHDILARRTEPFSILDLGCGDAAGTSSALPGTQVRLYVGVDCAAPALDYARANLDGLSLTLDLRVGDLSEVIESSDEQFDVVLACFAVHHLASEAKRSLVAAIRPRLSPGGEFILVDLVRAEGMSRSDWLEYQTARIRTWPIGTSLQEHTVEHVVSSDFPEESPTQPRWALEIGYREVLEFYSGGDGTQMGWRMLA